MLFILDLDETLLFSGDKFDDWFQPRPHLVPFLNLINKHFTLAIFSTADYAYCEEAVKRLFPFEVSKKFIFQSKYIEKIHNAETNSSVKIKKIHKIANKLGFSYDDVVILDDLKSARVTPLAKVIKAPEFNGDFNDDFLLILKNKIQLIIDEGFEDNISFVKKLGYIAENKAEYHGI